MSRGWSRHEGLAVALPVDGIDTDQLIPARYLSRSRADGYGDYLLHDLRFDAQGDEKADFPLNFPAARGASLLVAGRNFGGGSSREAAVYALADFGIRVVVAPSFGDIFAANAVNNGLLPALVSPGDSAALLAALAGGPARMGADLENCTLRLGEQGFAFTLDPVWRQKLMRGWDDIDLTASHAEAIAAFCARDAEARPWARSWARPGAET